MDRPLNNCSCNGAMSIEACRKRGMGADNVPKIEGWLQDIGFGNIQVTIHKSPIGTWLKEAWDFATWVSMVSLCG